MSQKNVFLGLLLTALLLPFGGAWATEVVLSIDSLIYSGKAYSSSKEVGVSNNPWPALSDRYIYTHDCEVGSPYAFCLKYYRQDRVKSLVSGLVMSSDPGLGWYGTIGMWQWTTLKPRSPAYLECGTRACWLDTKEDFTPETHNVVYAGGGLQYRFGLGSVSLTPFLGVVGHWPRIDSVSGTNHLFHLGLRGDMALTDRVKVVLQYGHFSNGNRLKLADRTLSNQGIEAISLGVGYQF